MSKTPAELREEMGFTQAEMAKALKTSQQQVSKLEKGQRVFDKDWIRRYSDVTGYTQAQILDGTSVPKAKVVGYVSAGDEELVFHEVPVEEIDAPPGSSGSQAVIIRGDSMAPRFFHGEIVFFDRNLGHSRGNYINSDCVVRLKDGRTLLKRVEAGGRKRTFTLRSYNQAYPTIPDAEVEWVAPVTWTRRR